MKKHQRCMDAAAQFITDKNNYILLKYDTMHFVDIQNINIKMLNDIHGHDKTEFIDIKANKVVFPFCK